MARTYFHLPLCSTPFLHPFKNREPRNTPSNTVNVNNTSGFKMKLASIKNHLPFTSHARDAQGKPLRGIHTRDNRFGKTFRVFRLLFVGVVILAAVGLAIGLPLAAHFATGGAAAAVLPPHNVFV